MAEMLWNSPCTLLVTDLAFWRNTQQKPFFLNFKNATRPNKNRLDFFKNKQVWILSSCIDICHGRVPQHGDPFETEKNSAL